VAAKNAAFPKDSKSFPVILLSHGSMGLASRLFWLGQYFVRQGAVVVAVDHPGNMFGDSSADGVVRVWDRAKDLSFGLDQVLKDPEFGSHLDLTRVSAAGHSVGGTTVLLLAGARFYFEQLGNPTPNCAGSKDPFYQKQCDQFKILDYKAYGKPVVEGDYSDSRIKSVIALDPGFARSLQSASVGKLGERAFVFVAEKLAAPQDEIHSRDYLKLLAGNAEIVPNSVHMSFLMVCKDGLPLDDVEIQQLCSDRDQKLRIQKEVAKKSFLFFQKTWLN
ncbi:MAG: alpha/beta hydrolase family protein, partial [Pseudobdellovibrionaceae bacterium]